MTISNKNKSPQTECLAFFMQLHDSDITSSRAERRLHAYSFWYMVIKPMFAARGFIW